jgi:hypothetical protein
VPSSFSRYARKSLGALLCVAAFMAAGCHHNNDDSGYGIGWVTLTDTPGDFTSYIVNVDSVELTGKNVGLITALSTPETVDFTKLRDISELWGSASIPTDTYTSATITLDYTTAVINVMVNGIPTPATVKGPGGTTVTTISLTVTLDPKNQYVSLPTYATTDAKRLAIDFNLPASNVVDYTTSPPTVTVKPFVTVATSAADNKPIRVRGPLINSSIGQDTYTVYVRPFLDEVDSLGSLTIFNNANTIYSINGKVYTGPAGLTALSQLSAGITVTEAYTTLQPTATPSAVAGIFNSIYVVAGSTVEDQYTFGIEGDVIARSGNTLTLRGATLDINPAESEYDAYYIATPDAQVLLGPGTIVTRDDATSFEGLGPDSISVGQHITARGIYRGVLPPSATAVTTFDATGTSSTNTGSVRIQSTRIWGSVVSTAADSVVLNLQTINDWPASIFNFAGTGATTAQDASAANYVVDTTGLTVPAGSAVGTPLWIDGVTSPFGASPPDFIASTVNSEAGVQLVDTPNVYVPSTPIVPATAGTLTCGNGNSTCIPASMQVYWAAGTTTPFETLTGTGTGSMSINLSNAKLTTGIIRIGAEIVQLSTLPATPTIVPVPAPATGNPAVGGAAGIPAVFLPQFTVGNPETSSAITTTLPTAATTTPTTTLYVYNTFATFVGQVNALMTAADPALQFEATGFYNRVTNTFNATSINVVL